MNIPFKRSKNTVFKHKIKNVDEKILQKHRFSRTTNSGFGKGCQLFKNTCKKNYNIYIISIQLKWLIKAY